MSVDDPTSLGEKKPIVITMRARPLQLGVSTGATQAYTFAGAPEECSVLTADIDKRALSERDICTKYITPALRHAGWDEMLQIREEVGFTKGRIIVRSKLVTRGQAKRADYVLYYKPNIPLGDGTDRKN